MGDHLKPYWLKNNIKMQESNNESNLCQEIETGFINVNVFDSNTNKPIENAVIEVLEVRITGLYHETGFGDIIITRETNSNGRTVPPLELLTNFEDEHIGGPEYEHIHYHFRVSKEDYHTVYVTNILVFPNITNSYRINLSPTSSERPKYEFIITPILPL